MRFRSFSPTEGANGAPPNPVAGFEVGERGGKKKGKIKKERDEMDWRKRPPK